MKFRTRMFTTAAVVALAIAIVTHAAAQDARKPKYAAEVPPSVTTPDVVNTERSAR